MNIGFFTDTYLPQINGVVTSIETFRKEMIKRGHRVFIFAPRIKSQKGPEIRKERENDIYRFFSVPYFRQREHRVVFPHFSTLRKFRHFKLDIVHTHTNFPLGIHATYLAKRHRIPVVHTYHTLWAEYTHYSPLPRDITRWGVSLGSKVYCNICDLIISPSAAIKEVLYKYGVRRPIEIIPTGLEADLMEHKNGVDIYEAFNLKKDEEILTFVGRLGKEKNLHFLLRAFKRILSSRPSCRLMIVGDGPEKGALLEAAAKLDVEEKVIFPGYLSREEVVNVLSQSTLFVFASTTETQGLSLIEALIAGIPAVVVDAMGVSDILAGDRGGFLVPKDEKAFAEKVLLLLGDKELYEEKKKEAVTLAHSYTAENMCSRLLEQYEKLLAERKKHRHSFHKGWR